ncbi:WecB/TagA/CpsF family glycosyltransferase [Methylocystis parvus]|uniref:WecB/TagA/CpsF family glycosyltransferase n=1 Tax=Methylocystis parvus TaxID=134 RepID=UPI003C7789E0
MRARAVPISVTVNIDGVGTAIDKAVERLDAGFGFCFYTLNLDHLSTLPWSVEFAQAYRSAELVSADGWPVVWLLQRQGVEVTRTTGADLIEPMCAAAAREGFGVYFVGPGEASQARAIETLRTRCAGLNVVGAECPSLSDEADQDTLSQLAKRISDSGARLCILSLGSPKQELIAYRMRSLCPEVGLIGVGAGMDFISGLAVRAPAHMQRWRLEWLWRLMSHPKRLAPRYWRCGTFFAGVLLRGLVDRSEFSIVQGANARGRHAPEAR